MGTFSGSRATLASKNDSCGALLLRKRSLATSRSGRGFARLAGVSSSMPTSCPRLPVSDGRVEPPRSVLEYLWKGRHQPERNGRSVRLSYARVCICHSSSNRLCLSFNKKSLGSVSFFNVFIGVGYSYKFHLKFLRSKICRLQGWSMMYFHENCSCAAIPTYVCDAVSVFTRRLRGKRRLLECGLKVKLGLQHLTAVFGDARVSCVANRGRHMQLCYGSFDCAMSVYLGKFTTNDPDTPHQFLWRANPFLDFYS